MVIDHPGGLHERVAGDGANEGEAPTPSDTPSAAEPAAEFATHEHDAEAPPSSTPTPASNAPEDRISDARLTYEQETGRTTS